MEIIVSLAIFSVVSVVAVGALLKIIDANKKAQSIQSAMTNINYALEAMSRELRVSNVFMCDRGTGTTSTYNGQVSFLQNTACRIGEGRAIIFKTSNPAIDSANIRCNYNLIAGYRFVDDAGGMKRMQKAIQPRPSSCAAGSAINDSAYHDIISASNVNITGFNLGVLYDNTPQVDLTREYPLAIIRVAGYTGVRERDKTFFDVQTAISARVASDTI